MTNTELRTNGKLRAPPASNERIQTNSEAFIRHHKKIAFRSQKDAVANCCKLKASVHTGQHLEHAFWCMYSSIRLNL